MACSKCGMAASYCGPLVLHMPHVRHLGQLYAAGVSDSLMFHTLVRLPLLVQGHKLSSISRVSFQKVASSDTCSRHPRITICIAAHDFSTCADTSQECGGTSRLSCLRAGRIPIQQSVKFCIPAQQSLSGYAYWRPASLGICSLCLMIERRVALAAQIGQLCAEPRWCLMQHLYHTCTL